MELTDENCQHYYLEEERADEVPYGHIRACKARDPGPGVRIIKTVILALDSS